MPLVFGVRFHCPTPCLCFGCLNSEGFGETCKDWGKTRKAPTFGVGIPGRKVMATKPWVLAWGKGAAVPQPTKSGA